MIFYWLKNDYLQEHLAGWAYLRGRQKYKTWILPQIVKNRVEKVTDVIFRSY